MDEYSQADQIINYYSTQENALNQDNIVALLREIQELLGCIPLDVQEQVSIALNTNTNLIRQLIKLYPGLTSAPPKHKITLCLGSNCKNNEAEKI